MDTSQFLPGFHVSNSRYLGKQWHPVKKAFRPKAGNTSYEKRKANDEAVAATKAKEKEMKEEKEAARQVSAASALSWSNLIIVTGPYYQNQGEARQQRGERTIRENGRKDASEACWQIEEKREEKQDVEVMIDNLPGRSMAHGITWNTLKASVDMGGMVDLRKSHIAHRAISSYWRHDRWLLKVGYSSTN